MSKKHCSGCRDNFYNTTDMGLNMKGSGPQCWSLATAKVVWRKRVHIDQRPPWNQEAEQLPNCYRQSRYVFVDPDRTNWP